MIKLNMVIHTTVSLAPLTAVGQPHVVRKGAELSVAITLNDGLPLPYTLELVAELVLEDGTAISAPTDEGLTALSSVIRYMLLPGKVTASLRPRINLLSSAFDGADTTFRIRVRAINEPSVEAVTSAGLVVRSKWPSKSKRVAPAATALEADASAYADPHGGASEGAASASAQLGELTSQAAARRPPASDSVIRQTSDSSGERQGRSPTADLSTSASDCKDSSRMASMTDIIDPLDSASARRLQSLLTAPVSTAEQPSAGVSTDDVLASMFSADELDDMLQLLADESVLNPANASMAAAPLIASLASSYESGAPPPFPTLQPPNAARATVTGIMPNRHRVRTMVLEPDGAASAVDSFDFALEDGRRKRRPLAQAQAQMVTEPGAMRLALPAWLDRVSLCKASGFLCLEVLYAEHGSARVRWCSANMNSTVALPLDRLIGGADLLAIFSPDSHRAISSVAAECATAHARLARDCGAVGLALNLSDGRRFSATCHLMMHTDGAPEGSLSLRRAIVLARVHSFALGGSQLLTFEHPRACDVPAEDGDVVRRLFGGRVHYASPSTIDMFGFDAWHFIGREAGCSLHPDDANRWFEHKLAVGRALQANMGVWTEHRFTHRHIHRTKGYIWVHCISQSRMMQLPTRLMQLPAQSSVHDSLSCALQEVIVRVRLAEAPDGAPEHAPPPPPPDDGTDSGAEPEF